MKWTFLRVSLYAILADRLMSDVSFCERLQDNVARKILGVKIGRYVRLRAKIDLGNDPSGITVSNQCCIDRHCTLFADQGSVVTFGCDVWLRPDVMLWTGTPELGPNEQRCGDAVMPLINIRDGCW